MEDPQLLIRQPFYFDRENRLIIEPEFSEVCKKSANEFLHSCTLGTYTSMRTVNHHSILELDLHVHRLISSCKEIKALHPIHISDKEMKDVILLALGNSMKKFQEIFGTIDKELKILAVLSTTDHDPTLMEDFAKRPIRVSGSLDYQYSLLMHISPIKDFPSELSVEVHELQREVQNPQVKSLDWIKTCNSFEAKLQKVDEILFPIEGGIREGLSSNFFAIGNDGNIYTAPDELVLNGSIRQLVLDVCQQNNLNVIFQCPNPKEISNWKGAFITSNSRVILPVKSIRLPEGFQGVPEHNFDTNNATLIAKIRDWTFAEMIKRSVKIL